MKTHLKLGGGTAMVAGRVRVVERRFQNDAGWFSWRGVSDLAALGYGLSGRRDQVIRRLDAYVRGKRTVVRALGMLGEKVWVDAGLAFSPSTPGYADERAWFVAEANSRGMYVEFDLFADAQIVMPDHGDRRRCLQEFAAFCRAYEKGGLIPGLVNEAFKNGWSEADDPDLLALADEFAGIVGHRDFGISDPKDGDNPDASAETTARMITCSHHSLIGRLHPDRAYGSDDRWRRWLDHLEGMTDVLPQMQHPSTYVIDEPIGASFVAQPGKRDNDSDAHVAAQFIALCCGFGYTYHKIDSEIDVDQLPGFYEAAELLAVVPVSPDWRYLNDSWAGAPTEGITWKGKTGKMRNLVNGNKALTVAYGEANFESVKWRPGWVPTVRYAGTRVRVWSVEKG